MGLFRLHASCPKGSTSLKYTWSSASGVMREGRLSINARTFRSADLRMPSTAPGEVIRATFHCRKWDEVVIRTLGPVDVVSGNAPFMLTPISAEAGYFQFFGVCPSSSSKLRFTWSPAANGVGWGEVAIKASAPVVTNLRLLSAAPNETVSVTVECRTPGGRVRQTYGPVEVASGNALLATPPEATGSGRRIVYSISAQQLWAIEADETVVRTYLVSGRRLELVSRSKQTGSFKIFSKSTIGCVSPIRCPNMVRFNRTALGNVGFHAIPYTKAAGFYQTEAELGQPRSGGCVRSAPADAIWLFTWSVKGDRVIVLE
jgi:hypothetical protein